MTVPHTLNQTLYSSAVLDFITVGTEYCKYLEQLDTVLAPAGDAGDSHPRQTFIDVMRGLLPMLYLKASLMGDMPEGEGFNAERLTEADYDYIRHNVASVMGGLDDYLDVFVEDFKYSDRPVLRTVSEDLADIYQAVRETVETFRDGYEDAMQVALYDVRESFKAEWGQKLLNALKALHDARFHAKDSDRDDTV